MIVIGTTIAPYKHDDVRQALSWLCAAKHWAQTQDVQFFAALEVDGRGRDVHQAVLDQLKTLPGTSWTFSLNDNAVHVDSENRLVRICTGRNLVSQYAHDIGASHILFVDSDVALPLDALEKLLKVDWPIVGGHVPTYCLDGPLVRCQRRAVGAAQLWEVTVGGQHRLTVDHPLFAEGMDLREHMNTAGFLLVRRALFRQLRWRWDKDAGLTDDPCYHADAARLGYPTWVRHDVVGHHWPPTIGALEHRGHDTKIYAQ
jgi:hypothetical protein